MDDNNFDDLLKRKLENYEDPDFDSGALAAFHERMVYFSPVPWYKKYRTETVVTAAFLLFTLLNSFIHWYGIGQGTDLELQVSGWFHLIGVLKHRLITWHNGTQSQETFPLTRYLMSTLNWVIFIVPE